MDLEQKINELEARIRNLERKLSVDTELSVLREELTKPAERTPEDIDQALKIIGMGEGPRDMAKNYRRYLYEGKQ